MTEIEKKIKFVNDIGMALLGVGYNISLVYDVFYDVEYKDLTEFLLGFSEETGELVFVRACTGDNFKTILHEIVNLLDGKISFEDEYSYWEGIIGNPSMKKIYS